MTAQHHRCSLDLIYGPFYSFMSHGSLSGWCETWDQSSARLQTEKDAEIEVSCRLIFHSISSSVSFLCIMKERPFRVETKNDFMVLASSIALRCLTHCLTNGLILSYWRSVIYPNFVSFLFLIFHSLLSPFFLSLSFVLLLSSRLRSLTIEMWRKRAYCVHSLFTREKNDKIQTKILFDIFSYTEETLTFSHYKWW